MVFLCCLLLLILFVYLLDFWNIEVLFHLKISLIKFKHIAVGVLWHTEWGMKLSKLLQSLVIARSSDIIPSVCCWTYSTYCMIWIWKKSEMHIYFPVCVIQCWTGQSRGVHVCLFDRFGGADQPGILGPSWGIQSILRDLPGKMTHNLTPLKALSGPLHII